MSYNGGVYDIHFINNILISILENGIEGNVEVVKEVINNTLDKEYENAYSLANMTFDSNRFYDRRRSIRLVKEAIIEDRFNIAHWILDKYIRDNEDVVNKMPLFP